MRMWTRDEKISVWGLPVHQKVLDYPKGGEHEPAAVVERTEFANGDDGGVP